MAFLVAGLDGGNARAHADPKDRLAVLGRISSQGDRGGDCQVFPFRVSTPGTVTIAVDWVGGGWVQLVVRDADRQMLASWHASANPTWLTFEALPGRYELAVLVKTGTASYVVSMLQRENVRTTASFYSGVGVDRQYPGQPAAGSVAWGSTTPTVARMQDNESAAGVSLALRRTFYRWDQRTTALVTTAAGDHAAGRLPWVSVKTPPWADMAAGRHDAEIDQLLGALDALDGPVWLTVHHEPEGDDPAGPAGHRGMNQRVRQRMNALGVDNVALAPILMAWTFDPRSGRDITDWWAPGVYDFLGIDIYRDTEASLITPTWLQIRSWAAAQGIDVAVGEWGMRGSDAAAGQRVREWYNHAANSHTDGRGARVVGLSAFDSGANSPTGSWQLQGAQRTTFLELLNDPRTARISLP